MNKAEEYAQGFEVIKVDKFGDIEGTIDKIKFLTDFSNQENKELVELLKKCAVALDSEFYPILNKEIQKAITNT